MTGRYLCAESGSRISGTTKKAGPYAGKNYNERPFTNNRMRKNVL